MSDYTIICGDALAELRKLPDSSVDLICTDPPYFRVKDEPWDRAWDNADRFIEWIGLLADEWKRILKPNGSLYCFASPKMAARVEMEIGKRFAVLNSIVWSKPGTGSEGQACKEAMRQFWHASERIVFAEHFNSDRSAMVASGRNEAGTNYNRECEKARGIIWEPIRAYLDGEKRRAGLTSKQCQDALGTQMAGHYFGKSQWCLPTSKHYATLKALFNEKGRNPAPPFLDFHPPSAMKWHGDTGHEFLRADYESLRADYESLRADYEFLRADYESLRAYYESLRRPFSVSAAVPHTDVWTFKPAPRKTGRHSCEKPIDMLQHIIATSSRPGAIVLDCFIGSGSTGEAALSLGRSFIGIEMQQDWCDRARARLDGLTPPPIRLSANNG